MSSCWHRLAHGMGQERRLLNEVVPGCASLPMGWSRSSGVSTREPQGSDMSTGAGEPPADALASLLGISLRIPWGKPSQCCEAKPGQRLLRGAFLAHLSSKH